MQDIILTADAGSTKTAWLLTDEASQRHEVTTHGINPYMMSADDIVHTLREELLPHEGMAAANRIRFYGAGCRGAQVEKVRDALRQVWPAAEDVIVGSDIVGAAHALYGLTGTGVACILGTGSNSCLYVSGKIIDNVSPLGYVLGDEGSGAVIGRRLVGDVLKRQLPPQICQSFFKEYNLTADEIIEHVYRQTLPNRFLASFVPFVASRRRECKELQELVKDEFHRFFVRNVALYARLDLAVGFVGGVAFTFQHELREVAAALGYRLGAILRSPLESK